MIIIIYYFKEHKNIFTKSLYIYMVVPIQLYIVYKYNNTSYDDVYRYVCLFILSVILCWRYYIYLFIRKQWLNIIYMRIIYKWIWRPPGIYCVYRLPKFCAWSPRHGDVEPRAIELLDGAWTKCFRGDD